MTVLEPRFEYLVLLVEQENLDGSTCQNVTATLYKEEIRLNTSADRAEARKARVVSATSSQSSNISCFCDKKDYSLIVLLEK